MDIAAQRARPAFEPVPGWAKLPAGIALGEVAAVGIDRQDRVYAFNRGPNPMVVFDRDGNFLRSWGEGVIGRAHGIHMAPDDTIYCTDEGHHVVRRFTLDGRLLLEIGIPGEPAPFMSGQPFHRCTHTALTPDGDILVSDGYGNACVHRFSPGGTHLRSWGGAGCEPGQFNLPHNICCTEGGEVFVADRENHRIQVFDCDGRYVRQLNNLHRPSALFMTAGKCPLCYVGEIGPYMNVNRRTPNLGLRVTIMTERGDLVGRIESVGGPGSRADQFTSPHGIAVDSRGDIYVGEVGMTAWPSLFPGTQPPPDLICLKKFRWGGSGAASG